MYSIKRFGFYLFTVYLVVCECDRRKLREYDSWKERLSKDVENNTQGQQDLGSAWCQKTGTGMLMTVPSVGKWDLRKCPAILIESNTDFQKSEPRQQMRFIFGLKKLLQRKFQIYCQQPISNYSIKKKNYKNFSVLNREHSLILYKAKFCKSREFQLAHKSHCNGIWPGLCWEVKPWSLSQQVVLEWENKFQRVHEMGGVAFICIC
jgi:hypothetical protein